MALVNHWMRPFSSSGMLPDIFFSRIPYLGAEDLRLRILDGTGCICGQSLSAASRPFDKKLVEFSMMEEHIGNFKLPITFSNWLQGVCLGFLPIVKLPDEVNLGGVWRPLAEYPRAVIAAMEAVEDVVVDRVLQKTVSGYVALHAENPLASCIYRPFVGHQIWVGIVDLSLHLRVNLFYL